MPIFVFLFVGVVMIGNIWLARVELENALEAAALAAVQEWGSSGGGNTLVPRGVGVAYAAANTISGVPVVIGANYDGMTGGVNQNELCDPTKPHPITGIPGGNLVFGAVTIDNPGTPSEFVRFNAGIGPSCGSGSVIFDASANGQSGGSNDTATDNWWGVSFRPDINLPSNITISRLVYNLRANGGNGYFNSTPDLSDNVSPHKVRISASNEQPDIFGFVANPASQISFSIPAATPWIMTVQFQAATDGGGNVIDAGFSPCDRMRFGVELQNVGPDSGGGNISDDGDSVGHDGVAVAVYFAIGGVEATTPVYATFQDTEHKSNQCVNLTDNTAPCGTPSMIVHPGGYPDVPCPPGSAAGNNGQSLAFTSGSGGSMFGVRAQAIAPVTNPLCGFCWMTFRPQYVTVKTTAMYDCVAGRARLIRVDQYTCPGP